MRGPEVLDIARYPEIAFVSTSVRSQARDGTRIRIVVAGALRLRGRSFPVEIPLEVARDDHEIVARGGLALNLFDLGVEPPSVPESSRSPTASGSSSRSERRPRPPPR